MIFAQRLAAFILILLLAAPSTSWSAMPETILEGQAVLKVIDYEDHRVEYQPHLKRRDGTLVGLEMTAELLAQIRPGASMRVRGRPMPRRDAQDIDRFEVQSPPESLDDGLIHAEALTGTTRMMVVLTNRTGDQSQPFTQAAAQQVANQNITEFYRQSSFGQFSVPVTVSNWVTIPDYTCDSALSACEAAFKKAGGTTSTYGRYQCWMVNPGCGTAGTGWLPGESSIVYTPHHTTRTPPHELGHNFGYTHAPAYDCGTVAYDPGGSCTALNGQPSGGAGYGDPYTVMGWPSRFFQFNSYERQRQGWLTPQTVRNPGVYSLASISSANPGTRAIRIDSSGRLGSYSYYLEYRQPVGFDAQIDNTMVNGLTIHVLESHRSTDWSYALDMTPETASNTDIGLPIGRTFIDPGASRAVITPLSASGGVLQVRIQFDGSLPTNPPPAKPGGFRLQ